MGLVVANAITETPHNSIKTASGASSSAQPALADTEHVRRVLVVDDDPSVLFTFQNALDQLAECEIEIAGNGMQALERLAEKPYDLLITDYRMPDIDGLTLASRLRQAYPATAVLLITAFSTQDLRVQAAQLNVECVLDKPVGLAEFRAAARSALNAK